MIGWIVAAYLAGALVLVGWDDDLDPKDWATVLAWPAMLPVAGVLKLVRKWRRR